MSREVRHDGAGAFSVRFPFDRRLVDLIKTLPNRRWNASERFWWVPEQDVVTLVDLLEPEGFRFDEATRDAYRLSGGARELPDATPAAPRLPGLFDPPASAGPSEELRAEDFTVSGLNEQVRRVIEQAFPQPIWLVGEISGFNRNAHKKHVSFQLAEKDETGRTESSVDATLFDRARASIARALLAAGEPFRLEDEVTVRVRARVELYVPWGSYRVVVEELDIHYTLGEAARRREEIVRRLTEAGLVGRNTALELPALPLRLGLITSLGSDAYKDVLRTLQESGFAFRLVAHGARVQGHATEPSVLNALDALRDRSDELDALLICRGGGSRTDLAWFDSEPLGRAVAEFPIPVIVGIGHEQDHSVLDAVGWRAKTPTAAAALLVDRVRSSLDRVERTGEELLALAARRIRDERRRGVDWGRRLGLAARGLLDRESVQLVHRRLRTERGARSLLAAATERVARFVRDIPRAGAVHLAASRSALDAAQRSIAHGARRDIVSARQRIGGLAQALGPRATRRLTREAERADARDRRLHLVHPRRVIERGYAVLRDERGGVLTSADRAPVGTALRAELKQGMLKLRSEGSGRGGD